MDDLIVFLAARLAEKEAAAMAAGGGVHCREWDASPPGHQEGRVEDGHGDVVVYDEGSPTLAQARHIALNDPASALREVAAIRAHIRMWEAFAVNFTHVDETEFEFAKREALEDVLAADAAIWSDHPDYPGRRQEAVTEPG